MKKGIVIFIILLLTQTKSFAQSSQYSYFFAKEYDKEISLFNAKTFLIGKVLEVDTRVTEFETIPLAASSSGELTTLIYKCEEQNKEGLILGFYGNYWNDNGVLYTGYQFKNFEKNMALRFLNIIQEKIDDHKKYLRDNNDYNNIVFTFQDMKILIWTTASNYRIRIYWNGFDSTWEAFSYERSKRRFEKKI